MDVESNCNIDTINLQPCNHEEVDSCMIVHLIDTSKGGVKPVLVATADTDVVEVLLYHFFFFRFEALWVEMGIGQHRRWLPIHMYAQLLTNEVCQGLPFLYAVTGYDTVSMFSGHDKKKQPGKCGSHSQKQEAHLQGFSKKYR